MSLVLTPNFVEVQNLVVPLAQQAGKNGLAIRVASNGSGNLGTLTASGNAAPVTWAIEQNPAFVTLSIDPTTLINTIVFSNAVAQPNAYQFFITATDGTTTVFFPIYFEVLPPFSIVATSGLTNFDIQSFDNTVADIVFQGVGLNGSVDTGVSFILPTFLPPGILFITSTGEQMSLRVAPTSETDISGGTSLFQGNPVSTQITLSAYELGTLYDNPNRAFTQAFTIESLTAKQGVLDLGLTVQYNTTLNALEVDSFVDFLNGQAQAFTFQWIVTGTATGAITSGGTSTSSSLIWTPATAGTVIFTLNILSATTNSILGQAQVAPLLANETSAGIPTAPNGSFESTAAYKLSFSADEARGWSGDTLTVTLSTPAAELASNETVTVHLTIATGGPTEATATLAATTLTLTATSPSAPIQLTLPVDNTTFNQKWIIQCTASDAASNPTRTGFAEVVFLSNGNQPINITTSAGFALTSNVGVSIPPITLIGTSNAGSAVPNITWSLAGAPAGLIINDSGQLTGNVLIPGTYTFQLVAAAANFVTSYSANVTLVASAFSTPLTISNAVPSVASLPDNQQFNVTWGFSGTPLTLDLIQGFTVRSVIGTTQASTSEVGSSVITIFGTSFFGDAYSVPAIVISSSVTANGPLTDAPTIGTIDEDFNLTLQWNPLEVDGSFQAYKAWNIFLEMLPNGPDVLQSINGNLPTGLEDPGSTPDSRLYETVLSAGDFQVSMMALTSNTAIAQNSLGWDEPHEFPTTITAATVTFDNQTISLGQTLTISLDPNFVGADTWQAIFPDGTTSGFFPISVRSIAKVFNTAGSLPIVIQVQNDFSSSNPPVKLNRQVTLTIFVMNQQFIGGTTSNTDITGTLGFGSESGFQIANASNTATTTTGSTSSSSSAITTVGVSTPQGGSSTSTSSAATTSPIILAPYEVIVRALVRDTVNNELKLMVATSRTSNASSLLGTMAIDVFPLQGRPRLADLIDPALVLTAEMANAATPVIISTTALPNLVVGLPMADFPLQTVANTGVAPFSWYADNLPTGVKLSINGTLSGTATQIGSFTSDFVAVDSNVPPFIAHTTLTLTVETNLTITTTTLPAAVVGTPYNQTIVNTGGVPPFTWSMVSGAPPQGVTLNPMTGILTGTPVTYNSTTDFSKIFTFTVQIADAIGAIASTVLSMTLQPAALQFGTLDQNEVFANNAVQLTIPVFGGKAPYTLASFTDDGVIGTGLRLVNPTTVAAVAGVEPPSLTGTTPNQSFFPENLPFDPGFVLSASGGTPPYKFTVVPGASTTLPEAAVFGSEMTGLVSTGGTTSVEVQIVDSFGNMATQTVSVAVQQQNAAPYSISPVTVALNGQTNPANFTITPIAALPDAQNGHAYNGGSGTFFGLALFQSGVLHITQTSGTTPMTFSILSGALPAGIVAASGNSFGQTTDFSGLVLFNVAGGQNATTNGSFSFDAEFSDIVSASGAFVTCVSRESITVTTNGGGTTPVVVVTTGAPIQLAQIGTIDQHYQLTVSADPSVTIPDAIVASADAGIIIDDAAALAQATFISGSASGVLDNGSYTYTTTFNLTGMIPSTAVITGLAAADDILSATILNGTTVLTNVAGAAPPVAFTINSGFIAGVNTLEFIVINDNGVAANNNGGGVANPTSLLIQMTGTATATNGGTVAIPVFSTGIVGSGTPAEFNVNLATASGTPFPWCFPLSAEGGEGPYTFSILTGSDLPGAVIQTLNGLPVLASTTAGPGLFTVIITATDSNGVVSGAVSIEISITETVVQPISIVDANLPASIFANSALAPNTFFVEANLEAAWSATGLPAGVTLTSGTGTQIFLQGTPTVTGNFTPTITATSISFNTTASQSFPLNVAPQTATFFNPPATATVGTSFRVVNNNAIIFVNYVGFQPTSPNLPLVKSKNGTVGAPGVLNNGTPTTAVSNLTANSFTMAFDYLDNVFGTDVLTLGNNLASININVVFPPLVVTGTTNALTVSEYSTVATFQPPVTVSGGLAPYTLSPSGTSDPRFTIQNNQIVVDVDTLPVSQTTSCQVMVLVVDSSGNSGTATGTIQVTVMAETFITVNFSNSTFNLNVASGLPFTQFDIPNQVQSIPVLFHSPAQFFVDSVTLPTALVGFVNISPTQRVLAVNVNNNNTSAVISDVNSSLVNDGTFIVPAVAFANAPAAGTYTVALTLRVVDAKNITLSQAVTLSVVIS